MAKDLGASDSAMGLAFGLTQTGYGLGLLFLVPLGDVMERRQHILVMLGVTIVALLAVAGSPSFAWLAVASLVLGAATIVPQLIVPLAASLANPGERGRVVGQVMSGLLIGILLSRVVSGVIGDRFDWRTMFATAAVLNTLLALVLVRWLPGSPPSARLSYGQLLGSLGHLLREEPALRESCLYGAAAFGAFSVLWTTLTFFLSGPPYDLHADIIGLFGLFGVAGALVAPLAGRLADRKGPRLAIGLGLAVMLLGYSLLALAGEMLAGVVAGIVLLDLGMQSSHISNQARIYSLRPEATNRLNTAYMVSFFVGGAAGSSLGSWAWQRWGWIGACAVGISFLLIGLVGFVATSRRPHTSGSKA
jgi:predicted MFS family arabinose efflux permease